VRKVRGTISLACLRPTLAFAPTGRATGLTSRSDATPASDFDVQLTKQHIEFPAGADEFASAANAPGCAETEIDTAVA
jgi:hypothetical protein